MGDKIEVLKLSSYKVPFHVYYYFYDFERDSYVSGVYLVEDSRFEDGVWTFESEVIPKNKNEKLMSIQSTKSLKDAQDKVVRFLKTSKRKGIENLRRKFYEDLQNEGVGQTS